MTEPTDAELLAEWGRVSHIADAGQRRLTCLRAVLAKWGTPPAVAGEQVDRADAVNLARNTLMQHDRAITKKGVRVLAEAVLSMDAALITQQSTQAQAEPKSGAKSFQTYGEANAYSKGYYAGKKAATQAQAQAGAVPLTEEQITAAAKKLAECMDYPWDYMNYPGQAEMRKHAQAVVEAAHGIRGGQHGTDT